MTSPQLGRISPNHQQWPIVSQVAFLIGVFVTGVGLAFLSVNLSFKLAIIALWAIFGLLLAILKPELGLLAIIAFLPLEDFNNPTGLGPLSVVKLLGVGALVAFMVNYLVISRDKKLVNVPQNYFILVLFLTVLVSNLVALDPAYAIDKTIKLLRLIALYFLIINIVRSVASVHRVFWIMVIMGLVASAYGLYEYIFTPDTLDGMRISGTYDDPLGLAFGLVILLPITWYLLKHHQNVVVRGFLAGTGILFAYCIILTGSRSGMEIAAIMLILMALREKSPLVKLTLVVLFIAIAFLFMPETVRNRLGLTPEIDKAAQASTERRLTYYTYGIQLFLERPFIGSGLGGFAEQYNTQSEYRFMRQDDDVRRIAHNMYLEIAVAAGLMGLIPFLLIFGSSLFLLERTIRKGASAKYRDLAKTILFCLIAYLLIGLFSSAQFDDSLWLIIGLAAVVPSFIGQCPIIAE